MKEFTLNSITIEMSPYEAISLANAINTYLDICLERENEYNINSSEEQERCMRLFHKTAEQCNAEAKNEKRRMLEDAAEVLRRAYCGYPFKF